MLEDEYTPPTMTQEQAEMARLQVEVDQAVENTQLMDVNATIYISVICTDATSVYWIPTFCTSCCKPKIVHTPTTLRSYVRTMATQQQRTLYELACKGNRTMEMVAGILRQKQGKREP